MLDALTWVLGRLVGGVLDLFQVLTTPSAWPGFADKEGLGRLIYYGGSVDFLFVVIDTAIVALLVGLWRPALLWGVVRGIEKLNNTVGRFAAWAGLAMVLQQVLIVSLQRIFRTSEVTFGPFGLVFTKDLSWFSEELKLYNAMIVTLCAAYTFIQGGHVAG